jgi:hypothetical protein
MSMVLLDSVHAAFVESADFMAVIVPLVEEALAVCSVFALIDAVSFGVLVVVGATILWVAIAIGAGISQTDL